MGTTYFTKEHEWIDVAGDIGTIGISNYAQHALGDLVFVELPEIGRKVVQGKDAAVAESVKAASDVYAPMSGEVIEVNQAVVDTPGMINEDPEKGAWFFKIKLADPSETKALMDRAAYDAFVRTLG
jgi:glycine cleavage system H protein